MTPSGRMPSVRAPGRPCGRRASPAVRAGRQSPRGAPSTVTLAPPLSSRTAALGDVHHRAADELRHEQVGRIGVDLLRAADLLQHAFVHDDDAVGERHRLDLVVRHIDRGRALLEVQPLDLGAHLLAQLGVERADRLVHQHGLRPAHQRPADRHALHVAARQRRRLAAEQVGRSAARLAISRTALSRSVLLMRVARSGKAMFS